MEVNYIVNEDGKREMDTNSKRQITLDYLKSLGLYPFDLNNKSILTLSRIINKNTHFSNHTSIFIWEKRCFKEVFSVLLSQLSQATKKQLSARVTTLSQITQHYITNDELDTYPFIDVLFITMNDTDFPHMYNAYCVRNVALSRCAMGKFTYFYFTGTKSDIESDQWKLDKFGDGKRSVIYTEKAVIDARSLISLQDFIEYVDLNILTK